MPDTDSPYAATNPSSPQPADRAGGLQGRGLWCGDASTSMVTTLATAGFDWVCVDLQHGRYGRADLVDIARARTAQSAPLVVRVPSVEFTTIGLALDVGASAVIVPQIDTPEQAAQAVEATFYPPRGRRSHGQLQMSWGRRPWTSLMPTSAPPAP